MKKLKFGTIFAFEKAKLKKKKNWPTDEIIDELMIRSSQSVGMHGDTSVGSESASARGRHQRDGDLRRQTRRLRRSGHPRRAADLRPGRTAPVRPLGTRNDHHIARQTVALSVAVDVPVPDREQFREAHDRQPQRRDIAGHGDQRRRGRQVAQLHLPLHPHEEEPARLRHQHRDHLRRSSTRRSAFSLNLT